VGSSKSQRLIFTFSNSGVVHVHIENPGLKAEPSSYPPINDPTCSSSKIVGTVTPGIKESFKTQLETPDWVQELKNRLGMPSNAIWRRLTTNGTVFGDCWKQYELRFFGMLVEEPMQTRPAWPFWRISDTYGTDVELIQLWYQQVKHKTSVACCEAVWHPDHGESITFPGLENAKNQTDVVLAWRARILLQKTTLQGRPSTSVHLTQEQFQERAPQAYRKLLDTFGDEPTDVQIAEELYISRATFYRYVRDYKLSINEIRNLALKI
jgi:hypothetical protein